MKLCGVCKWELDKFLMRFKDPNIRIVAISYGNCTQNFLDNDNKVKTCYQYFVERISHTINQPERSKREDLDCYKCRLIKDTIELPICNHTNECDSCFGLLKLIYEYKNKMRCSEHYREGNEG
jgi:hypothetical protein